jgi:tetratricopeptide (TPR) repeat protein
LVYGLKRQIWLNILNGDGKYAGNPHYTTEEKIKICQKMIDINKIIFEEEGMAFMDVEYYFFIEYCHLQLGNTDEAIAALEKLAELAIFQSNLPETGVREFKSLLINTQTRTAHSRVSGGNPEGKNMAHIIKRVLESKKDTRYAAIKDDGRYQKILDRLGEYAD